MNRILFFSTSCLLIFTILHANNPLSDYVSDETFENGKKNFTQSDSIFKPRVYSLSAIKSERKKSIDKMMETFKEVTFVIKKSNTWSATFYYLENGNKKRKTVSGRSKMSTNGSNYLVTPYENGIKIKDIKTGYETELEKKGR